MFTSQTGGFYTPDTLVSRKSREARIKGSTKKSEAVVEKKRLSKVDVDDSSETTALTANGSTEEFKGFKHSKSLQS